MSADDGNDSAEVEREDLSPYFVTVDDFEQPIDWKHYFDNDNPIELDIGCGRGLFLVNAAERKPDTNFLGMELDYKEGRRAARRLKKRQFANARIVGGDCRRMLQRFIMPSSVAAAHVYFPDPWWKRRHLRRRLFTDEFAELLARVVRPEGLVHSWTDVEQYFGVITALMDRHAKFRTLPPPAEREPRHDLDYQTSFERKKRQLGSQIWRGLWQRC
ncbi:MAG: tRNA (guanosine(46)-N7)-methyltransferase TrmB [Planctomycetaceae bacterium]